LIALGLVESRGFFFAVTIGNANASANTRGSVLPLLALAYAIQLRTTS
jgi:hypothetical protein